MDWFQYDNGLRHEGLKIGYIVRLNFIAGLKFYFSFPTLKAVRENYKLGNVILFMLRTMKRSGESRQRQSLANVFQNRCS